MSKYIYTTIYEQFTGLKPPEPKDQKPKRRRGYGHPYRMRLNMQDDHVHQSELLSDKQPEHNVNAYEQNEQHQQRLNHPAKSAPFKRFTPERSHSRARHNHDALQRYQEPRALQHESHHASHQEPKVTYKKRRHFGSSHYAFNSAHGDANDRNDY